jgi:hypothetical protein
LTQMLLSEIHNPPSCTTPKQKTELEENEVSKRASVRRSAACCTCHKQCPPLTNETSHSSVQVSPRHAHATSPPSPVFVAVQHAKVSEPEGELAVAALSVLEHEAMAWAVHGLEPKRLLLDVEAEHVVTIMVRMSARVLQRAAVTGWHHMAVSHTAVQQTSLGTPHPSLITQQAMLCASQTKSNQVPQNQDPASKTPFYGLGHMAVCLFRTTCFDPALTAD